MALQGTCQCGSIRFQLSELPTAPTACHCTQCRKQSGHFFASANVPKSAVTLQGGEHLAWYRSSQKVRRGFCSRCGSWLFWEPLERGWTSVALGAIDGPTGLALERHIFVDEQGDYYRIADGLPQHGGPGPAPAATAPAGATRMAARRAAPAAQRSLGPAEQGLQPLRLPRGVDLRDTLEQTVRQQGASAFVVCGIGSLGDARLRLAGARQTSVVEGPCEIVSLSGSLTPDGAHLHMTVADARGRVRGGHVVPGNVVRTTAELLLAWLPGRHLGREFDPQTGHAELVLRAAPEGSGG